MRKKKSVHLKRYTLCLLLWKLACDSSFERIYAVGLFPRHVQIGAAHVTVGGELSVNRAAQISRSRMIAVGRRSNTLLDGIFKLGIGNRAGAEGVDAGRIPD